MEGGVRRQHCSTRCRKTDRRRRTQEFPNMLRPDTFALTALLALLTALGPLAVDMYLPSFPDIARLLNTSPATVQLTLSLYMAAYAVGQIVYGPLSDRFGRLPVLRFGARRLLRRLARLRTAPNIELLLAARATAGARLVGAIVLARAIVRDLYSAPARAANCR
jgi:DHA1 family bicyclomycin/chloramphenicol resistance-like MFS transporter